MKLPTSLRLLMTIKARVILLFLVFILISATSSYFLNLRISEISDTVSVQLQSIDAQNELVREQNQLMGEQQKIYDRVAAITQAQLLLSELQYWFFHASLAADRNSLSLGETTYGRVKKMLADLAANDPEREERFKKIQDALDRYQGFAVRMFGFYEERSMSMGKSMSERARGEAIKFITMLNQIRGEYEMAQKTSAEGVASAADKVAHQGSLVQEGALSIGGAVEDARRASLVGLGFMVISCLLLGAFFIWSVVRPVRKVTRVISDIEAQNDLTRTIDYDNSDELQDITEALDRMLLKFRSLISDVGKATEVLQGVAAEGADGSLKLADQVNQQQAETSMVAAATNEMTATAKGIQETTDSAAHIAEEVTDLTEAGRSAMAASVRSIEDLANRIQSASEVIGKLAQRTESIGGVLDVIRGISEQTNLLALNAAIEAARAGELGRGFAVVADEVRSLAKRTNESTTEIQEVVQNLQRDAESAVGEIGVSLNESKLSVAKIDDCRKALEAISDAVARMHELNHQVAQATAEQCEAVQSIDRSIDNLSGQTNEINGLAEATTDMSSRLNEVSSDIRTAVGLFKF
ncbi:methyl-accepting chemotaxis protein [Hahella sp. HN01]|uniref:methyl-accepting chemotaxis protein n=1 Tax=Hahella sp. HN01 TaxID=2847262 RepID=UPI001C1EAD19|nr:methyl-accepting chemotaxis protein [Hahella sp. HN01]MBU6955105.1 methyl-accepting chemotaxis protein [Hahella sp. HN01]